MGGGWDHQILVDHESEMTIRRVLCNPRLTLLCIRVSPSCTSPCTPVVVLLMQQEKQ